MARFNTISRFKTISSMFNNQSSLTCQFMKPRSLSLLANQMETKTEVTEGTKFRKDAVDIFKSGVASVNPCKMLGKALKYDTEQSTLEIDGKKYLVNRNIFVIGMGSAALGMAKAVENVLGEHVVSGVLSIPKRIKEDLKMSANPEMMEWIQPSSKIRVYEGAVNNKVDEAALNAGKAIQSLAEKLSAKDILVVLISGGGTALCPLPHHPITWEELRKLHKVLGRGGASLIELNTVLQNLEVLKGGGLAKVAQPAQVVSFILSNQEGDPINLIAGGTTVHTDPSPNYSLRILERLDLKSQIPANVVNVLDEQAKTQSLNLAYKVQSSGEQNSNMHTMWANVQNVIVGNNIIALKGAEQKAKQIGYCPLVLDKVFHREAKKNGLIFAKLVKFIMLCFDHAGSTVISSDIAQLEVELIADGMNKKSINRIVAKVEECNSLDRDVCLIASGDLFVHVTGHGVGGQCSEMAAASALQLYQDFRHDERKSRFCILTGDSYGKDGTTSATGSIVDGDLLDSIKNLNFDMAEYLRNNDTFSAFNKLNGGDNLFTTLMTGTDVMDLFVVLVQRAKQKKFSY